MSFLDGGYVFSQLYHLSSCHPNWVTCALYMLLSAGFSVVTINYGNCFLL